jgi:hypothetical protein
LKLAAVEVCCISNFGAFTHALGILRVTDVASLNCFKMSIVRGSCSEDEESDEESEAESGAEGEEEADGFEKIKSAKEKKKVRCAWQSHPGSPKLVSWPSTLFPPSVLIVHAAGGIC